MAGNTGSYKLIDGATCATTGTIYSQVNGSSGWLPIESGFAFTLWYWIYSLTGTAQVSIYLDVSPYSSSALAGESSDATLYTSETVVSGHTTESALVRYSPTVLGSPCMSVRVRATGGASNSADTVATVVLTKFGLG